VVKIVAVQVVFCWEVLLDEVHVHSDCGSSSTKSHIRDPALLLLLLWPLLPLVLLQQQRRVVQQFDDTCDDSKRPTLRVSRT
jgi:hypothetical protein